MQVKNPIIGHAKNIYQINGVVCISRRITVYNDWNQMSIVLQFKSVEWTSC